MEVLREEKLGNGVHLSFMNESRKIAGDRWEVVLKLVAEMPLTEAMFASMGDDEEGQYYRGEFSDVLRFELVRKRHFVDESEMGNVLDEIIGQAETNMMEYLSKEDFAAKVFEKQLRDLKERYCLEKQTHYQQQAVMESDEPLDFSGCFK